MAYPTGYRITVGSTPVQIISPESTQQGSTYMVIKNTDGSNAVDLGDQNVTSGTGYKLAAGDVITFWMNPGQYIYAAPEAGSPILAVLENLR